MLSWLPTYIASICIFINVSDSYVQHSASLERVHESPGDLTEMQALIQEA